jgi:hypothetical protein
MPAPTGGVLGTIAKLPAAKPAAKNAPGGVLGTIGTLPAGSTLPFTGFPVWAALLAALGLVGAGFGLRRAGSSIA